jgi:hypothetical protein
MKGGSTRRETSSSRHACAAPGRSCSTRSGSPDLVEQETWGYLLTLYAVSALICEAATGAGIDPDRVKFKRTVRCVPAGWMTCRRWSRSGPDLALGLGDGAGDDAEQLGGDALRHAEACPQDGGQDHLGQGERGRVPYTASKLVVWRLTWC